MHMKRLEFFFLVFTICMSRIGSIPVSAQERDSIYEKAVHLYQEHRFEEAIPLLEKLLKTDSMNVLLLNTTANSLAAPNYTGMDASFKEQRYRRALFYANRAVKLDPQSSMAHYNVGLALGRLSEGASTKVKVASAKQIRISCEESMRLNPVLPWPVHIMGRWHREVAGFNLVEQKMISLFFGKGIEGGTYEEAIRYFDKAMKLDPKNPAHYYEMGVTYLRRGDRLDKSYAKAYLKKAAEMPARFPEDVEVHQKAVKLLKEITD